MSSTHSFCYWLIDYGNQYGALILFLSSSRLRSTPAVDITSLKERLTSSHASGRNLLSMLLVTLLERNLLRKRKENRAV